MSNHQLAEKIIDTIDDLQDDDYFPICDDHEKMDDIKALVAEILCGKKSWDDLNTLVDNLDLGVSHKKDWEKFLQTCKK